MRCSESTPNMAICIHGADHCTVQDNEIYNMYDDGVIKIENTSTDISITGNSLYNVYSTGRPINLDTNTGSGAIISNNTIINEETGAYDGIYIRSDNVTVENNYISGITYSGIALRDQCEGATVTGNTITNCGTGIERHSTAVDYVNFAINFNNIYGNETGFGGGINTPIDVRFNYWGEGGTGAQAGQPGIGGNNGCNATADYTPWLHNGELADGETIDTNVNAAVGENEDAEVVIGTINVGNDGELAVYQSGSVTGEIVNNESFPGSVNKRIQLVWGFDETNDVSAASIKFEYDYFIGTGLITDQSTLVLLKRVWSGSSWDAWQDVTASFTRDDTNHWFEWNSEGRADFEFGDEEYSIGDTGANPLPVTLTTFVAVFSNDQPKLQWNTSSELNNSGWNVYRSIYDEISTSIHINPLLITGAGSTTEMTKYEYIDEYEVSSGKTYYYWLESVSYSGENENYGPITLEIPEIEEGECPEFPLVYGLHQNYPNPFNPSTRISFAISEKDEGPFSMNIYNLKGQLVKMMFNENELSRDKVLFYNWDGKNTQNIPVTTGIYFYQLKTKNNIYTNKMILSK